MTLDERLDNLAQTVELLAGMQIKTEEKMQQLIESNQHLDREMQQLAASNQRLDGAMLQVAKILQHHEERLDRHEQRLGKLDQQ